MLDINVDASVDGPTPPCSDRPAYHLTPPATETNELILELSDCLTQFPFIHTTHNGIMITGGPDADADADAAPDTDADADAAPGGSSR